MSDHKTKGSCLCGTVTYEIQGPYNVFQYCHCSRCRKTSGSAHSSSLFVSPKQFKWLNGEDNVGRYELPEAKYYATAFCKTCGSSLPWTIQGGGGIIVPAGTLDDDPGIKPKANIFWNSRASWLEETANLKKFDETPQ